MSEEIPTPEVPSELPSGVSSDDKLLGAVSYFVIVAIILLLVENQRNRPFIKYHAVQSIAANIVLMIVGIIIGMIPFVQCLAPLIWLVLLWPAIDAFKGNYTKLPFISDFIRKQGWVA